jgi:sugar/nucleoside kinase (ribokinase family)
MSSAPRTISIGGATYDLFVTTDRVPVAHEDGREAFEFSLGEKVWIKTVFGTYGGGAANTSVGLARLGCSARFCGIISSDQWGEQILANLKKENVGTDSATIVEGESSSFSTILSSPTGERVILAHQGTSRHLHDVTFDREQAAEADWVYLNHIHADTCVIEDDLIAMLIEPNGPKISWNPGGCQIDAGLTEKNNRLLLAHTDLILLNKEEALAFTTAKTTDEALRVLATSGVAVVCITDGKNGSIATDGTHVYRCPAPACPVADTTGAGDAFGTGMTWALVTGKTLPEALKTGTINAMSVVGRIGAQPGLLTGHEMQERLTRIQIDIETDTL